MLNLKPIIFGVSQLLLFAIPAIPGSAETWTDATGKFSIEAKFMGVEGKDIVLLKENGTQLHVPIAKLSDDSRARAKSLYEQMKQEADELPENTASNSNPPSRGNDALNFKPPALSPTVSPMQPFPENMSLEQTVEYLEEQMRAGRPQVLWYMLPQEMRETFDDQRVRNIVGASIDEQAPIISQIEPLVFKAVEVLINQKQFVLGSEMLAEVPADTRPLIEKGYAPAVGAIYELADFAFSIDLQQRSIQEMVDYHCPRIGSHLKELSSVVPKEAINSIFGSATIEMTDDKNGIVRIQPDADISGEEDFDALPSQGLPFEPEIDDTKMTLVAGRWVTQELHDTWTKMKAQLDAGTFERDFEESQTANADEVQGAAVMVGMFTGMAGSFLDSLAAASTQEEFDAVFQESNSMLLGGFGGETEFEFSDDTQFAFNGETNFGNGHQMETGKPVAATGEVPEGWTLDLSKVEIPDEAAQAVAGGTKFKIGHATIGRGILHLNETDDFIPNNGFVIFTFLEEDESLDGKKFEITPKTGFNSPHIHMKFEQEGKGLSGTEIFMDKYAMRLQFGKASNGKIPGKIYLCLPDGGRSIVRGTFDAVLEK